MCVCVCGCVCVCVRVRVVMSAACSWGNHPLGAYNLCVKLDFRARNLKRLGCGVPARLKMPFLVMA